MLILEKSILANLLKNDDYLRKAIPFLKKEYFSQDYKIIFSEIEKYFITYNKAPTKEALEVLIDQNKSLNDVTFKASFDAIISIINEPVAVDQDWLLNSTERFCQEKAVHQAILQTINIYEGKDKSLDTGSIPKLLSDALAVSFDPDVGHDYFSDWENRFNDYHKIEARIPFDLDILNKITNGGLPEKTLTVILGGVGVGKSLCMCHMAAANLLAGKNVLYITLELSQEVVSQRIDANLMNINMDDVAQLGKSMYESRINLLKKKTMGKLYIKEYPTASAGSMHFRGLLHELNLKKNFKPDIIYLDYINLCLSSRIKMGGNAGSYLYIKTIAEEIRGLAGEFKTRIITATQLNREGFKSSNVDLTNTAESFGLPATADLMFAIVTNDELKKLNQYMVIQLKNRLGTIDFNNKFYIGVDTPRMKLYNLVQNMPVQTGTMISSGNTTLLKSATGNFSGLKI